MSYDVLQTKRFGRQYKKLNANVVFDVDAAVAEVAEMDDMFVSDETVAIADNIILSTKTVLSPTSAPPASFIVCTPDATVKMPVVIVSKLVVEVGVKVDTVTPSTITSTDLPPKGSTL